MSNRHLIIERETVNTAQVKFDLNELSADVAKSEQPSILTNWNPTLLFGPALKKLSYAVI